ncbi:MAG TPA: hypothetical protein VGN27_13565 [Gaiellaceae bacterium]|jgi:hypothetical protein|nr:hypothetical protein [Gaiellaceae bacterium]
MKRFITLALAVLALAAVPAAFADNGSTPPAAGTPPVAQQGQAGQGAQGVRIRLELLRLRIRLVELRFAHRCGSSNASAPQACLDFAKKAEDRLTKVDGNLTARIAKIQQACGTASTDPKCKNADQRIALLQKIDAGVQALAQKVQDWLDGKTVASPGSGTAPGSSTDSSLDQAAAGLGQLVQQAGGNG